MNRAWILAGLLACSAASADAATVCRLASGGGMAFGLYDILSTAPNDSLLNLTVACDREGGPRNITVNMRLSAGANGTAVDARRMAHAGGAGEFLAYGLFRDVGRSSVWGFTDGVDTVARMLSVPNKGTASTTFTIYGRIPAQQDVRIGSYTDMVQVTITP